MHLPVIIGPGNSQVELIIKSMNGCQGYFQLLKQNTPATSRKGRCGGEVASTSFTWPGTKTGSGVAGKPGCSPAPSCSPRGQNRLMPGSKLPLCLPLPADRPASSDHPGLLLGSWAPAQENSPSLPIMSFGPPITSCCIPQADLISNTEFARTLCSSPCLRAPSSLWKWLSLGSSCGQMVWSTCAYSPGRN